MPHAVLLFLLQSLLLFYISLQKEEEVTPKTQDTDEEEEIPLFNPNASKELPQASDQTTEAIDSALKDLTPRYS